MEIQGFANYDTVDQKLAAGLQARQIPDIVVLSDISWNRYYLNDTLEPLDGYFTADFGADAYNDRLLDEGRAGGSLWWTPLARSTPLMYLNPEILDAAGLPLRAPTTWDEYRSWGMELAGVSYDGGTPRLRAYAGGDDWYFTGSLWSFGGAVSDAFEVTLDSAGSLAAAQFDHDIIHTDKSGYLAASHTTDFLAGNVACIESSTGSLTSLTKNAKFDLLTGFLPKQVDTGVPSGGSGLAIMRSAAPERKQAAFEFLKFMAAEQQSADWSAQTGYLPCTKAAAASDTITTLVKTHPNYGVAVAQLEIARRPDDVRKYVSTCIQKLKSAIQQMYAGDVDPEPVMTGLARDLRRSVERVLTQYPGKLKV